jgi:hypothetical protein
MHESGIGTKAKFENVRLRAVYGRRSELRIMSNRASQFVLPFGAGLVAAAVGLVGLFLALSAAIAAAAMAWTRLAP